MFTWRKQPSSDKLGGQADAAILRYEQQRNELENHKQQEVMRQVELWSILTPTSDLEKEYKDITADIAFTIKKILCLDEHINSLRVEKYHCASDGACDRLRQLLEIPDPCSNVSAEVPKVNFS